MTTFNHAREKLAEEMIRLQAEGQECAVWSIDISPVKTGDGAKLSAVMASGQVLAAYFGIRIDPAAFDREPYLAQMFSTSGTIH